MHYELYTVLIYIKLCMSLIIVTSFDFDESIQIVRFSPRQSFATAYIKIQNDDRVETIEAFQVDILLPYILYSQGFHLGNPSKANIYIKDGMQTCRSFMHYEETSYVVYLLCGI